MASFDPGFLDADARGYLWAHADESTLMRTVREACEEAGLPVTGPDTGTMLAAGAAAAAASAGDRAPRALEVGCLYGYSALWLLRGLGDGGQVGTIEFEPAHAARARETFERAGAADRVTIHEGAALDVLPDLEGPVDVVFLDAAKAEYPTYLDHALGLVRPGAVILADNVLWHGRVWDEGDDDPSTAGIREFNRRIAADARLASTILPLGDGLSFSVVRS